MESAGDSSPSASNPPSNNPPPNRPSNPFDEKTLIESLTDPLIKGAKWYLIASKWFQQWKRFVDEKDDSPGPLDNTSLIEGPTNMAILPVKKYCKENEDFVLVNEKVYKAFSFGTEEVQQLNASLCRKVLTLILST